MTGTVLYSCDPHPRSWCCMQTTLGLRGSTSLKPSSSVLAQPRPSMSLKHAASSAALKPRASSQIAAATPLATTTIEDESSSEAEEEGREEEAGAGGVVGHIGPPCSDMLLLRRGKHWATVLADARVILLFAEFHSPWKPYWHEARTKQVRRARVGWGADGQLCLP